MPLMVLRVTKYCSVNVQLICSQHLSYREVKESLGLHSGWKHVWRGLVPLMVSLESASSFNGQFGEGLHH